LYESLGLVVVMFVLLQIDRRANLREGRLFLLYGIGYSVLRFFVEGLRIDPAKSAGGLRLNQWVSIVVFCASVAMLLALRRRDTSKA